MKRIKNEKNKKWDTDSGKASVPARYSGRNQVT
jgi:hypothetical protein